MKKILIGLGVFALLLFAQPTFAHQSAAHGHTWGAVDHDTVMHVFVRDGCPHCAALERFMDEWFEAGGAPDVTYYEVMNKASQELFAKVQERMPGLTQGVPTIILDGHIIQGYETDLTTGKRIKDLYEKCLVREDGCITFDAFMEGAGAKSIAESSSTCSGDPEHPCEANEDDERFIFDFWFVGKTDLRDLSLPALSLILGGLDGFNPCAMWVLISLLTLLINTRSWTKIFVIGGTFLLVSGAMYYLFIAAWLNVFLLLGFNQIIQKIIGIVAIGGGSFYLYEAFGKDPNQCKVTNFSQRQKTIDRMKKVLSASSWPLMIGGVAILAASVNLVELVCTAGLPAIFSAILAQNALTSVEHYWYLLLYILAYMFDDLIIYAIAIGTLHATGFTTKYRRFTLIFGGVLMATLGVLLIFFPEALTFD
ncbi:MAG TPA: glutaredoxin [Candidatus Peribacterales bacterium]|nr:glutaredoxin [Candidatus Peribacterales bacterium]